MMKDKSRSGIGDLERFFLYGKSKGQKHPANPCSLCSFPPPSLSVLKGNFLMEDNLTKFRAARLSLLVTLVITK